MNAQKKGLKKWGINQSRYLNTRGERAEEGKCWDGTQRDSPIAELIHRKRFHTRQDGKLKNKKKTTENRKRTRVAFL